MATSINISKLADLIIIISFLSFAFSAFLYIIVDGILDIINGHGISFCKGLGKLISGFVKQQGVAKQQKALE